VGTLENLSALTEELRGARERLEAIADRAATLEQRLSANGPTILALDRLNQVNQLAQLQADGGPPPRAERFEGEEVSLETDAWEISLISDEK
jgi:hypothetical protein